MERKRNRIIGLIVTLALTPVFFVGSASTSSAHQDTPTASLAADKQHKPVVNYYELPARKATRGMDAQYCIDPHGNPCDVTPRHNKRTRWSARKFRKGRMGHVKRMVWKKWFRHPKQARNRVRRIFRRAVRENPDSRLADLGARRSFRKFVRQVNCVGDGAYRPYTTGFDMCGYTGQSGDTKEGIQRGGSVILCGGVIVVGVMSSGVGTPMVLATGANCGFATWLVWD